MTVWSVHAEEDPVDLTVFVSCYNEATLIRETLLSVTSALDVLPYSCEVVVIDDASKDNSLDVIKELAEGELRGRIRVYGHKRNCGLAFNFIEGAHLGRGKYYRCVCGDAAESRDVLINIFKHIGESDMVVPYQIRSGRSLFRRVFSRFYVMLVNGLSGYRLRYYNGSPIFRRRHVIRWPPLACGFGFQADLITRLLDEGCSYIEIESISEEKKFEKSSALTVLNGLSVCHTLLEIGLRSMKRVLCGRRMHLKE